MTRWTKDTKFMMRYPPDAGRWGNMSAVEGYRQGVMLTLGAVYGAKMVKRGKVWVLVFKDEYSATVQQLLVALDLADEVANEGETDGAGTA